QDGKIEEYSRLVLELTESIQITEVNAGKLQHVHNLGLKLAMDDFGTGYSNLNYVRKRLFQLLKFDRVFIRSLHEDQDFVQGLIALARLLKIEPVAEGVETGFQLDTLIEMGCEIFQGFFCSKPVPVEEFEALVLLGPMALSCWQERAERLRIQAESDAKAK
ncbi:MAG: EAL domain-containing protein, partial [Candidatus Falkowbacteria bacterium]|nr:EAL domain-containing protein [Candidatus Falkowbacteria bacterium]